LVYLTQREYHDGHKVNAQARIALLLTASLTLPAATFAQGRLYRWVDDKGAVHYGDRVPPEYANRDRDVLNDQGVAVSREQGELTDGEKTAMRQKEAETAREREARAEVARRDRMLLETYLSVADIEALRDERLELLEAQIGVTELYLDGLRQNLASLDTETKRYAPHSNRENAPPVPADLTAEIASTESSITLYEDNLARTRDELVRVRTSFDADIARFRQLKGDPLPHGHSVAAGTAR
jgi:hypothetical protein